MENLLPRSARKGWRLLCNVPKSSFGIYLPSFVQLSLHLQNLADLHSKTVIGKELISFSHQCVRHVISVCNLSSFYRKREEKHLKVTQPTFASHPHYQGINYSHKVLLCPLIEKRSHKEGAVRASKLQDC